ncbi:hypothetical protein ARMGADRAFT_639756 [Armillaria gallica]|uniref:EF-hand domain-containing protein n=1 Tax=Armillaria gallica TaxID=47427 RepID=A0A2H3DTQ4_ARMGA|nr:hypothetical protein ARMGADRAFT_639756 [Armillaria gallica]
MPKNTDIDTGNSSKSIYPSDMSFEEWFTANTEILASVSDAVKSLDASLIDKQSLDRTFASYGDISKILLKGLKLLADVHPVIQVTVSTFEIVLAFESARRENDRKVGILRLQTQDLLIAIFQLHSLAPEETALGGRKVDLMGALMKKIAQDIKIASSFCDFYMNKKFLSRMINSLHYEFLFTEHITGLVKDRKDLELALQVHMARVMNSANAMLENQGATMKLLDGELKKISAKMENLFRQVDTTRERDIQTLFKDEGGAKKCVGNELLLKMLIQKSGEDVERALGHQAEPNKSLSEAMKKIQKELLKELAEDVKEAFKKNVDHFNKKLDLQEQQLKDIKKGNDKIIATLEAGPHQYIIDDDFKELWRSMAWKRNVKARYLVLALYDHLVEKLGGVGTSGGASDENDLWALSYFNGPHVQPLLEAIDDDATGFITTREINTFIESVPEHWTILQWIAYWAEGWHLSVDRYKERICVLLSTMYNIYPRVLPGNRNAVITYLQHETIYQVDKLLLSTHNVSPNPFGSIKLWNLTEEFTESEEKRIQKNLEAISFDIDAISTVSLITGPGRIERYIYPLLYLILKRHLAIVRLSTIKILHPYEIPAMTSSLWTLFFVVHQRVGNLSSIFKQSNVDVVEKLENFAFGMFKLYHDYPYKQPSKSAIAKYANEWPPIDDDAVSTANCIPLYKPPEEAAYCIPSLSSVDVSDDLIQGQWAGHLYYNHESLLGLIQLAIESKKENGTFTGRAATWKVTMDVLCEVEEDKTVHIRVVCDDGCFILIGQLEAETGTITGGWFGDPGNEQYHDQEGGSEKDDGKSVHRPDQAMEEQEDQDQAPQHLSRVATEGDNRAALSEDTGAAQGSHSSCAGIESRSEVSEDDLPAPDGHAPTNPGLDPRTIHTFLLRRTPASLWQFLPGDPRYYPVTNEDAGQRARARWRFAFGAVLEQVKSTLLTRNYVEERFTQVRRFVGLARRECYMVESYCPQLPPLSEEEAKELSCLRCSISPMHTRSYYALLSDEIERQKYNDYTCDSCMRRIVGSRLACLTCMNDSFTDTTDLCTSCIRNSCDLRGFVHDPSHVLLKFDTLVLDANMHWIIPKARSMLPRIQKEFRSSSLEYRPKLEERTSPASGWYSSQSKEMLTINESTPLPKCGSCKEMISMPCWVYVTYWPTGDMYVCDKCGSRNKTLGNGYLMSWPLLRIDDAPAAAVALEARLAALEKKFDEHLSVVTKLLEKLSNSPPDAGANPGAGF